MREIFCLAEPTDIDGEHWRPKGENGVLADASCRARKRTPSLSQKGTSETFAGPALDCKCRKRQEEPHFHDVIAIHTGSTTRCPAHGEGNPRPDYVGISRDDPRL